MLSRASYKRRHHDLVGVAGKPPLSSKLSAVGMRFKQAARQPVVTVQMQLLLAANVDPDECEKRKQMAAMATELMSPLRTNRIDYAIKPGMFTMCHYDPHGGLGRTHMSNDSCLITTSTPAGLPVDSKLCFPAMAAINTHPGNSQQTLRVMGVDSYINTGNQEILPGDMMILDPVASMVPQGPNGDLVSAIEPPDGVSKDFIPWNVRGTNPVRQQQDEQEILAVSQRRMGESVFRDEFVKRQGDAPRLRSLIKDHCTSLVADNFRYGSDDPRRGFLELHAARFLCTLVAMGGAESLRKNGVASKRCLLMVMQDLQRAYEDEGQAWRSRFPSHLTTAADPYHLEEQHLALETGLFESFLKTVPTSWEEMAKVDCTLNHAFDFYARLQSWRVQDYLKRFIVGKSLTHTMPGKLGDAIIGEKC